MSVNGINDFTGYSSVTGRTSAAAANKTAEKTAEKENNAAGKTADNEAAVYEKGNKASAKTIVKINTTTIDKMKADAEARTAQLRSLVEKMMVKQGQTVKGSMDYLLALKNGTLQVDDATRAQAQKDIAADGYWGVEQTSDRLVSFAQALASNDPSKADELMAAIEKGYKQATKSWGSELPDICKQTLDATREKMNNWKNSITAEDKVEK